MQVPHILVAVYQNHPPTITETLATGLGECHLSFCHTAAFLSIRPMTSFASGSSCPAARLASPIHHFLIHVLYHLKAEEIFWNCFFLRDLNLSDLKEVISYQAFPLECLVTKSGVGENEEGDFNELWQLFLNNDVDNPGGDSFIE